MHVSFTKMVRIISFTKMVMNKIYTLIIFDENLMKNNGI